MKELILNIGFDKYLLWMGASVFCAGIFFLFYRLVLDRKASFRVCRIYLVSSIPLSAIIPALNIPVYPAKVVTVHLSGTPYIQTLSDTVSAQVEAPAATAALWHYIYLAATALAIIGLIWQLCVILNYRRRGQVTHFRLYDLIENCSVKQPFSFFRNIFIQSRLPEDEKNLIISHETSHIKRGHSAELVAAEVMKAFLWFNPFVWLIRRSLTEVHEYQADADVLSQGYEPSDYRLLIFKQLTGWTPELASRLSHSLTKKRFTMMTKTKRNRRGLMRLSAAVPVAGVLMMLFSFTSQPATTLIEYNPPEVENINGPQIVDALTYGLNTQSVTLANNSDISSLATEDEKQPAIIIDDKQYKGPAVQNIDDLVANIDLYSITVFKPGNGELSELARKYDADMSCGAIVIMTKQRADELGLPDNACQPYTEDISEAMFVVDGAEVDKAAFEALDKDTIESITVLKGETAARLYDLGDKKGVIVVSTKKTDQDEPFVIVEEMPLFNGNGGIEQFRKWVMERIRYPKEALDNNYQGRVTLSFIVERDGSVSSIEVINSPAQSLTNEAVTVVSSSPRWTPGKQRGYNARVKFTLPVDFRPPTE